VDIKAYIASGILETYALGMTNEEETLEVESLLSTYPELRAELEQIELGLEAFAQEQAIEPPADLKASILTQLGLSAEEIAKESPKSEKTEDTITPVPSKKRFNLWTLLLLIPSIILGILTAYLYAQYNYLSVDNQLKKVEIGTLKSGLEDCEKEKIEKLQFAENELKESTQLLAMLAQENTTKIMLGGTDKHPDMKAVVYWNKDSKETIIANANLPAPNADQDYQLWAIVDGKPVDLGLMSDMTPNKLSKMKSVGEPQAFAITLEPKGGSKVPTMENMITLGALS